MADGIVPTGLLSSLTVTKTPETSSEVPITYDKELVVKYELMCKDPFCTRECESFLMQDFLLKKLWATQRIAYVEKLSMLQSKMAFHNCPSCIFTQISDSIKFAELLGPRARTGSGGYVTTALVSSLTSPETLQKTEESWLCDIWAYVLRTVMHNKYEAFLHENARLSADGNSTVDAMKFNPLDVSCGVLYAKFSEIVAH
ncbi:hypothetical protein T03_721 [Trichinella britovi]|uniref:Uncharacterized protein n=1 Tax=Trichinella britovi TaxID=45882 RepID=A0A0V1CNM6_TRIBR|nr:hypothetical protein T03_721 [Trichinella britovi]